MTKRNYMNTYLAGILLGLGSFFSYLFFGVGPGRGGLNNSMAICFAQKM